MAELEETPKEEAPKAEIPDCENCYYKQKANRPKRTQE